VTSYVKIALGAAGPFKLPMYARMASLRALTRVRRRVTFGEGQQEEEPVGSGESRFYVLTPGRGDGRGGRP
jgi:hypothetical protein